LLFLLSFFSPARTQHADACGWRGILSLIGICAIVPPNRPSQQAFECDYRVGASPYTMDTHIFDVDKEECNKRSAIDVDSEFGSQFAFSLAPHDWVGLASTSFDTTAPLRLPYTHPSATTMQMMHSPHWVESTQADRQLGSGLPACLLCEAIQRKLISGSYEHHASGQKVVSSLYALQSSIFNPARSSVLLSGDTIVLNKVGGHSSRGGELRRDEGLRSVTFSES